MATYYLINGVQLGQTKKYPGEYVDSTYDDVTAIQAAGGVLVVSSDTTVAAGALLAQACRLQGGLETKMTAIMTAAYEKSLANADVVLTAADAALNLSVNAITPAKLSVATGDPAAAVEIGVNFILRKTYAAAGTTGTGDDVMIYTANAPFKFRVLDVVTITTTEIGGSSATLRDAISGGGNALSSALSSATQVTARNALTTATRTIAANGSLVLARTDRATVGEVIITCVREA